MIHRISAETLSKAIEETISTLKDLEKRLAQILKSENLTIRRMKWVQHKSSLERIDGRIRNQCGMLQNLLSVAQM